MHGGGLELALLFLLAAVIAVPVFRKFGLGAVLGYLAAGVVLGPYGVKVISDAEPVLAASEIGVVMMLFVIGLELSPARLRVMRKPVFGAGGLQVLLSGLALGALAMFGGHLGWKAATVVGLGLALSSTAVCLQLLSERKGLAADYGRRDRGGGVRRPGAAAPGVPDRRAYPDARGVHRRGPADRAGVGVDPADRRAVGRPGRVPGRRAAGRFGIPPRAGIADRAVQGP